MINQQTHFESGAAMADRTTTALTIAQTQAMLHRCALVDPIRDVPERDLIDAWGAHRCLRDHILPWRRIGGAVVILTHKPELFQKHSLGNPNLGREYGLESRRRHRGHLVAPH